MTAEVASFHLS